MFITKLLFRSLIFSGFVYALPSSVRIAPRAVCTPAAGGSESTDDTPAIEAAIKSCGNGGTIVIPTGSTYYLNTALSFAGCSSCDVQSEGLMKFTHSTSYWNGKGAMILVSDITGAKIRSLTGAGVIDGNGQDSCVPFSSSQLH